MYHEPFLRRAIELSATALENPGTEPFAAVVVRDGRIVGEGINRSAADLDPTSHGETEAIRDACRRLGTLDLRGCELYTSCEPCALCVAAMKIAGISSLYYAADLAGSNAALQGLPESSRIPIDAETLRRECGRTVDERAMPAQQAMDEEATAVIAAWAEWVRTAQ